MTLEATTRSLTSRARDRRVSSVRWAWKGRLAIGNLTVQTGIESIGKSVFAAWMAGQFTRGELEGEWHREPVTVLLVAGEDDSEDVWMPRLMAADADLDRVAFLEFETLGPDWNICDGSDAISEGIKQTEARVVFIDAVLDHMPPPRGGESINSPVFVRHALAPVKQVTRKQQTTTLYSMHPPKSSNGDFRTLVQNSQAFSAVPRTGLLFDFHPDDVELPDQDRRRVLVRGKGNMGRDPGGLEFQIRGHSYVDDDGRVAETEKVYAVKSSPVTRADLAAASRAQYGTARAPSKAERAAELIAAELADGEWHEAHPLREKLYAADCNNNNTVNEAKRRLGVESEQRKGQPHGGWIWRIPSQDTNSVTLTPRARDESPPLTLTLKQAENPTTTVRVSESTFRDQTGAPEGQSYNPGSLRARDSDPNRTPFTCTCADSHAEPSTDIPGMCAHCFGAITNTTDHKGEPERVTGEVVEPGLLGYFTPKRRQ